MCREVGTLMGGGTFSIAPSNSCPSTATCRERSDFAGTVSQTLGLHWVSIGLAFSAEMPMKGCDSRPYPGTRCLNGGFSLFSLALWLHHDSLESPQVLGILACSSSSACSRRRG